MTADSEDFPKAIIPHRPAPTQERYDTLARRIADPMVTLFLLQQPEYPPDLRFKAAAELMPYRHRKLRPHDPDSSGAATGQQVNVQIIIGEERHQVSAVIPTVDPLD